MSYMFSPLIFVTNVLKIPSSLATFAMYLLYCIHLWYNYSINNPINSIECNLSPFVNKCYNSLILIQLMNSVLLEECLTHIRNYDKA